MSSSATSNSQHSTAPWRSGPRSLSGNIIGVSADVSNPADVEALQDRALSAFGSVHLVCNNAGIERLAPSRTLPSHGGAGLDVNLLGVVHGCRASLPLLTERQEGHIVNTASIAGLSGHAMLGAYTASKFAVVGLSECLHHELARRRRRPAGAGGAKDRCGRSPPRWRPRGAGYRRVCRSACCWRWRRE